MSLALVYMRRPLSTDRYEGQGARMQWTHAALTHRSLALHNYLAVLQDLGGGGSGVGYKCLCSLLGAEGRLAHTHAHMSALKCVIAAGR